MEHLFLPAIVPYTVATSKAGPWRHPTHWLNHEHERDFYPAMLGSYAHWRKEKNWNVSTEHCKAIFGDSGGYSVVTRNEQIDPERVMRWQLRRCTEGMILDIPPYVRSKSIQFTGAAFQFWEDSLRRTARNVERALPIYQDRKRGSRFRWWGGIQGETVDQMEEWFDTISSVYPFTGEREGWALAPKPSTSYRATVRYLAFARDHGLRRLHFLQVTKVGLVGVLFALAKLAGDAFDYITYDSATATRCAINRVGIKMDDDGLGFTFIQQKGNQLGAIHDLLMSTDDPAADYYKEAFPLLNREWPRYVLLWNHHLMVRTFENLYQAAQSDPEALLRRCAGESYGDVLREWNGEHRSRPQVRPVGILSRVRR